MIIEAANEMALKLRTQAIRVREVTVTLDPRDWHLAINELAELAQFANLPDARKAFSIHAHGITFTFRPGESSITFPSGATMATGPVDDPIRGPKGGR